MLCLQYPPLNASDAEFGLYIDKHGNPTEPIVEWEGEFMKLSNNDWP